MSSRSLRQAAAVLLALSATLGGAASARAAQQWQDGQLAQAAMYVPCLDRYEAGALVWAGYETDPGTTRAGDVFYGHAVFGAPDSVGGGCADHPLDQAAEIDVVLPPGVSLAVDAQHPIYCFSQDDGGPAQPNSTCPTHAVTGTYGPMLPAGDGGAAWDMPPGRTLEVQFPLVSTRELKGAGEGHCPTSVDDIAGSPQRDCLLVAEHVFDGTLDPWLAPNVQMVVGPRVVTPKPTPTPTPAPTVTPTPHPAQPAVATAKTVKLASLLAHGLTATVTVPTSGATAALRLEQGPRTLAKATKRHLKAGTVKVHLLLSQAGRAKLRHAKAAHLTLVAKIGAKTLKVPVLAKR